MCLCGPHLSTLQAFNRVVWVLWSGYLPTFFTHRLVTESSAQSLGSLSSELEQVQGCSSPGPTLCQLSLLPS